MEDAYRIAWLGRVVPSSNIFFLQGLFYASQNSLNFEASEIFDF